VLEAGWVFCPWLASPGASLTPLRWISKALASGKQGRNKEFVLCWRTRGLRGKSLSGNTTVSQLPAGRACLKGMGQLCSTWKASAE